MVLANYEIQSRIKTKLFISVIFIIFCSLYGCATNPVTGQRELQLVSESREISVGDEQYLPGQQLQGGLFILDKELSDYIDRVGQNLAKVSDRPLPYEFKILNSSIPNAWALPGGKIAINRGLLTELHSESELAAVLSHEIVHAAARHGAKNMERGLFLQAVVIATSLITEDKDYGFLAVGGAQVASGLITQKYSRSAEFEADRYGMHYMARAGYDPRGAVSLQKTFQKLDGGKKSNWLAGLFASHPPSTERLEVNQRTAEEIVFDGANDNKIYPEKIAYLKKIAPAYEKYDEAKLCLGKADVEKASELIQEAIKIEPKEALFHGVMGDIYFTKKEFQWAIRSYNQAIELNNRYFYFFERRGLAYKQIGDFGKAKEDLLAGTYLLPTAISHNELGSIFLNQGNRYDAKRHFLAASASKSDIGKSALSSYVELDLPDNPRKYVKILNYENEGKNARFLIINKAPIPVTNILLNVQFRDKKNESHTVPHKIKQILKSNQRIMLSIGPDSVPVPYQNSLSVELVSAGIL